METRTIYGSQFDLDDFHPLTEEEIYGIIYGVTRHYNAISTNVDRENLVARIIHGMYKAKETWDPAKGASFKTHLGNHVNYAAKNALRSGEAVYEKQIKVPLSYARDTTKPKMVFEHLDVRFEVGEARYLTPHDRLADDLAQLPSDALVARGDWEELAHRVMTLRGYLRLLPSRKLQRDISLFEMHCGLRGEKPMSLKEIALTSGMKTDTVSLVIRKIWDTLKIMRCPIQTALELRNTLYRMEHLRGVIGNTDDTHLSIINPSPEKTREIQNFLASAKAGPKEANQQKPYLQVELDFEPIRGKGQTDTVTRNVCRAFAVDVRELLTHHPRGNTRYGKARLIIAYTLCQVGRTPESMEREGFMKHDMVRHARLVISRELRRGNTPGARAIAGVTALSLNALRRFGQFEEQPETA